ncbi:Aldose 1-/Glucose-6-phosphate 1-epimerase [Artemisia annua]|uniref:Acyl carrier protein n=1 Tax=Artemisia annua TaxID=35608 RepID=A0A2U1N6I7_ARTAN|nr:Aldose 1-/Glucose-6-phosphate 1-epimerase [Artemisia annua]
MAFATVNKDTATLGVKVGQGLGNLPKVVLTSFHGSEAELYLSGGCVTSWKVGSKDLLFVRPDAVFNGQKPIRNSDWSIVDSDNVDGSPRLSYDFTWKSVKVKELADFQKDLSLDSLDRAELVMDFEQEFSIEIPDEQADKLKYCDDVANYIMSAPKQEAASEDS